MAKKLTRAKKNAYHYLNGAEVAVGLERTQINKFHTKGGTGFAAEEANALNERLRGNKVEVTGTDNSLNGTDRIVNGVPIQTKYFESASKTLNAAFSDGSYRYAGQLLEVPADQYEECLALMREKIKGGKVPGVSDPTAATELVKKGDYTYRQARNIARAGNLDSLVFDAKTQAVTTSYAFAISFTISFAQACWSGREMKTALKDAAATAFQSGATSLLTGIATAQILRTKAAALGTVVVRDGVKVVARSELGKSAIQKVAEVSLGKAVYGAAAVNHVSKLLRSNAITATVTTVIISAPDLYRATFSGTISWAQFGKNLAINGAGAAGGAGGWFAGAALGASVGSVVPVVGTAVCGVVGGILGALAGGMGASAGSKYLLDGLIEDDAKQMVDQLPGCLEPLCTDYLLSADETKALAEVVRKRIDAAFLRLMYQSSDRAAFVYQQFEADCERIAQQRARIAAPKELHVRKMLSSIQNDAVVHLPTKTRNRANVTQSQRPRMHPRAA